MKSRSVSSAPNTSGESLISGASSLWATRSVTSRSIRAECVLPSTSSGVGGQLLGSEHPGADRVVDVVVQVRDPIGEPHDLRLERGRRRHRPGVVHDPVAHLPREVQPLPVVLEVLDDPQALLVVPERAPEERRERLLPEVPERRVPEVVPERDRLGEVLVQTERAGGGAGDLRDVEGVGEPHPVVVALGRQEDLGLVLEPAERLRVHDPVAVALEARCAGRRRARRARDPSTPTRARRAATGSALDLLGAFSGGRHTPHRSRASRQSGPVAHPYYPRMDEEERCGRS